MISLSSFQWKILTLVGLITILNYIDRSSISFAIQPIKISFGIDNAEFGVIAAAFGLGYILMAIYGGILVDKFGTVGLWAVAAAAWSVITMLMGLAEGFWSFFWLRILLGIGEGVHFPALLKTVTNWLPPSSRARAISISLSGVPFASIVGAPLTTYLIAYFGWQAMFVILGSLGVIWAIAWLILFRKHPQALFSSNKIEMPLKKEIPWKALLCNRSLLLAGAVYFAFGYTIAFALLWLPGYLQQMFAASILSTGYLVLPPWIAAAIFLLFGGWLSDHLLKRTKSLRLARSSVMGVSLLLSGFSFLALAFSNELSTSLIWMTLGLGIIYLLNAPVFALVGDLFKPYAGTVLGILSAAATVAGIISPALTGWLVQSTGSFQSAFFLAAALSITVGSMQLLFHNPDKEKQKFL